MKKIIVILVLCGTILEAYAKTDYNKQFYNFYIKGEMVKWVELLDGAKNDFKNKPNGKLLEDIVRAQYGLIAYYIGADEEAKAIAELKEADAYLKKLYSFYGKQGWVYALDASFQGFKLIINPYRFFMRGPAIFSAINKSNSLAPGNFDVMFLKANQTFYLPAFLGGSQEKGLELYDKLEEKLLEQKIRENKNWFALLYLTSYGIACSHAKEHENAVEIYNNILKIEPGYDWVRKELLPQAENKKSNQYLERKKKEVENKS